MGTLIIILTYVAYVFIVVVYTVKIAALRIPPHIRWDLYPVIHEENYRYGGSCYEQPEWWTKPKLRRLGKVGDFLRWARGADGQRHGRPETALHPVGMALIPYENQEFFLGEWKEK